MSLDNNNLLILMPAWYSTVNRTVYTFFASLEGCVNSKTTITAAIIARHDPTTLGDTLSNFGFNCQSSLFFERRDRSKDMYCTVKLAEAAHEDYEQSSVVCEDAATVNPEGRSRVGEVKRPDQPRAETANRHPQRARRWNDYHDKRRTASAFDQSRQA